LVVVESQSRPAELACRGAGSPADALRNEPELGKLPNALDFIKSDADRKVMELHFTQKAVARPFVAPREVPPERIALLRKAFEALAQDPSSLPR
jgi:hypothetical protein